ncbi:MAG TPA: diguanylate cyclase [Thermoanaerobaculia bacterium]|mgnify:CR=1 FL=1|nr:diguanylate cyclase [Thermoanaerobaculia bacterium]HUM31138.1 diguanylate cyclase [Thermoanaerobaculia bacterium]HXK69494.1 diguanylate cyclase [Thermoanaerobaculia bacterium]
MNRVRLLFQLLILFFVCLSISGFRYAIKNYSNADGLPQSQILAVHQDGRGYLWIGTYCGVSRYSGHDFITLTTHDGIPNNYVYAFDHDSRGNVYVATNAGICRIGPDLVVERLPEPAGSAVARSLLLIDDTHLIYHDTKGYQIWDGSSSRILLQDGLGLYNPAPTRYGATFYLPTQHGLYRYRSDMKNPEKVRGCDFSAICVSVTEDGILVGTADGLYRMDGDSPRRILACRTVRTILHLEDTLWVGTDEGLFKEAEKGWVHLGMEEGLTNEIILTLAADSENTLWIGTNAGLGKLPNTFLRCYFQDDGLPSNRIWCIYEDQKWGLLAGGQGGISHRAGDRFTLMDLPGIPGKSTVRAMARTKDGTFWIGTYQDGLYRIQNGRTTAIHDVHGVPLRFIFGLTVDQHGLLWGATSDGALKINAESIELLGVQEGLPDPTVWQIVEAPDGTIFAATDRGIAFFDKDRFVIPDFLKDVELATVRTVAYDDQGQMWIGTNGDGIILWDGRTIKRHSTVNGFVDDFIWGIVFETTGAAWIGTNRGLVRMGEGWSVVFNSQDGLSGDEMTLNSDYRDRNGNLWFGILPGLVHVQSQRFSANPTPPRVTISKIQTNRRTIQGPSSITMDPGEKEAIFHMDGLSFQDEREVRYSYRMADLDRWSSPTSSTMVRYTNIPPGTYHFQVKACNNFGVWTEIPAEVKVIVRPAWYQTVTFRGGMAVGFLLLVFGYVRFRLAASRRAQKHLEHLVAERTEDLYRASITDPLLGIYNRRYVDDLVERHIKEARRHRDGMCLALIDLDQFKAVNDELGHIVGDKLLVSVAERLRDMIRTTDILARYGGDEFIIVFFRTDATCIEDRLASIVRLFDSSPFTLDQERVRITVSIGATCHTFSHESRVTYDAMLNMADNALYEAKSAGKNQYVKATL